MDDITFSQSMWIILNALLDSVREYFRITEQQLEEFTTGFIQRLPKYIQKALEYGQCAARLLFCELKYWFFKIQVPFFMCEVWVIKKKYNCYISPLCLGLTVLKFLRYIKYMALKAIWQLIDFEIKKGEVCRNLNFI